MQLAHNEESVLGDAGVLCCTFLATSRSRYCCATLTKELIMVGFSVAASTPSTCTQRISSSSSPRMRWCRRWSMSWCHSRFCGLCRGLRRLLQHTHTQRQGR